MRGRLWTLFVILAILILVLLAWPSRRPDEGKITLGPPAKSIKAGQEFELPLLVSVPRAINAGEFYFTFPKNLIEVTNLKKDDSFFALWVKDSPTFSNQDGTITIAGGLPSPGFTGEDGLVITIVFKAKQAGVGKISLDRVKTRLLANDGQGSKVQAVFHEPTVRIK